MDDLNAGIVQDTLELVGELRRSWEVLSSTVLDARGAGTFRMSEPLNYGEMLAAKNRALALPTSPFLTPIRRWGQPMDLDEGSWIKPLVPTIALDAVRGNSRFSVPVWIAHDNLTQVTSPAEYSAAVAVGTPDDVVTLRNGQRFLDTDTAMAATVRIWSIGAEGFGNVEIPIPDDPGLVGVVFCFQWWIRVSPDRAVASDVIGVVLRDTRFQLPDVTRLLSPTAQPSQSPSQGSSSFLQPATVALRQWDPTERPRILETFLGGTGSRLPEIAIRAIRASVSAQKR